VRPAELRPDRQDRGTRQGRQRTHREHHDNDLPRRVDERDQDKQQRRADASDDDLRETPEAIGEVSERNLQQSAGEEVRRQHSSHLRFAPSEDRDGEQRVEG